jgi:uncharacterized protein (DUF1778 family)
MRTKNRRNKDKKLISSPAQHLILEKSMSANASGEFNICLSSGEQHLLRDAAEKSGVSLAGFIRVAALREAEKLAKRSEVSREESVVQTRKESEKLIESLERQDE